MSSPGIFTSQMTPEYLQQLQAQTDQQRKMAMAQSLMGNQAQGQNGGLANAGSDILGALTMKRLQQQADPMYVNVTPEQGTTALGRLGSKIGGLFSMGGG